MPRALLAALAALVLSAGACASVCAAEPAKRFPAKPVQVFDVKAGKVVLAVENDAEFQEMANGWLRSVTGLSPKLQPGEACGFVYRVPLAAPGLVKIGATTITVRDVFLFHCEREKPLLLVFDANNRPYLLEFAADIRPFLRKIAAPGAPPGRNR